MPLNNGKGSTGVNWLDMTFIIILFMSWLFITQVWESNLAVTLFSLTGLLLSVYIISRLSGFLQFIKISIPTWSISGLISIPLMFLLLAIIPSKSSVAGSSIAEKITEGVLSQFFSQNGIVRFIQIYLIPITESLFIIFILAFFLGVASRKGQNFNSSSKKSIAPLFMMGGFGALLHTSIAEALEKEGTITFGVSLGQQFLSFFLFAFMGLFLFAPAIITSHVIKNLIVFGTFGWWIGTFAFFIIMDLAIITLTKNNSQQKKQSLFKQ